MRYAVLVKNMHQYMVLRKKCKLHNFQIMPPAIKVFPFYEMIIPTVCGEKLTACLVPNTALDRGGEGFSIADQDYTILVVSQFEKCIQGGRIYEA